MRILSNNKHLNTTGKQLATDIVIGKQVHELVRVWTGSSLVRVWTGPGPNTASLCALYVCAAIW